MSATCMNLHSSITRYEVHARDRFGQDLSANRSLSVPLLTSDRQAVTQTLSQFIRFTPELHHSCQIVSVLQLEPESDLFTQENLKKTLISCQVFKMKCLTAVAVMMIASCSVCIDASHCYSARPLMIKVTVTVDKR